MYSIILMHVVHVLRYSMVLSVKARQDEAFADLISYNDPPNRFTSRSRVDCNLRCVSEKCASYFYNTFDKRCQLNDHGSFGGLTVVGELGSRLYREPVDGSWAEWSAWSAFTTCSLTCGSGGIQTSSRVRVCTNPRPWHGGAQCIGSDSEDYSQSCNEFNCPIDGRWSAWGSWSAISACTMTCNEGTQQFRRSRSCTNPAPQYGGAYCVG